jgi:chromosomal replication initiator protein
LLLSRDVGRKEYSSVRKASEAVTQSAGGNGVAPLTLGGDRVVKETLAKDGWAKVLTDLEQRVGEEVFNLWLRNTLILRLEPELAEVGVPNLVVADWLEKRYSAQIAESVQRVAGFLPRRVKFSVNGHLFKQLRLQEEQARRAAGEAPRSTPAKLPGGSTRQVFTLNERYTLDRMIVGPSNQLAFRCAWGVVRNPGTQFNPLFIVGRTGLGKTHLLQGIARELMECSPGLETLYIPAEYFVNQYVLALQRRALEGFRKRFRNLDVLLIDDLHFLAGKEASQQELLHTFDALEQAGRQVVLASDQHPRDLQEMKEQLTTRFMQGMIAEIGMPQRDTRLAIIHSKIEGSRGLFPRPVVEYLANVLECNVRELEGYITRLRAVAGLTGDPITLQLAEQALEDFLTVRSRLVELTDIENVVIAHFNVSGQQLRGRVRKRPVALARQVCMYLARVLTSYSLKEIGRHFGGKSHSTVVFAVQAVEAKMQASSPFADEVEHLRRALLGESTNGRPC